jgi:hypothetical protein
MKFGKEGPTANTATAKSSMNALNNSIIVTKAKSY